MQDLAPTYQKKKKMQDLAPMTTFITYTFYVDFSYSQYGTSRRDCCIHIVAIWQLPPNHLYASQRSIILLSITQVIFTSYLFLYIYFLFIDKQNFNKHKIDKGLSIQESHIHHTRGTIQQSTCNLTME